MNQSIIETLTMVSDALATVTEPDRLASVAAQAIVKALGCQSAAVWLLVRGERSKWLTHLEQVPGVGQAMRRLWKDGSHTEGAQLRLASTNNRQRVWQRPFDALRHRLGLVGVGGAGTECTTLAALTGGQVTTVAELSAVPSRALRVSNSDSGQGLCLVAGLFQAEGPVGVLVCTWDGADETAPSDPREVLVVGLANYLGHLFGDQLTRSPEVDLYLAGTGLFLTALDIGPPAAKECAEAVTRSALEMATDKDLPPAEVQSLQWAALFHEVGRAPMDRWLTFPTPDVCTEPGRSNGGDSADSEPDGESGLALIPDLQSAATLLAQVTPVLDGQDSDLGEDIPLPARLLVQACLSSHCRQARPSAESAMPNSNGDLPQTEEPWDTISPHVAASLPEGLSAPAPQAI